MKKINEYEINGKKSEPSKNFGRSIFQNLDKEKTENNNLMDITKANNNKNFVKEIKDQNYNDKLTWQKSLSVEKMEKNNIFNSSTKINNQNLNSIIIPLKTGLPNFNTCFQIIVNNDFLCKKKLFLNDDLLKNLSEVLIELCDLNIIELIDKKIYKNKNICNFNIGKAILMEDFGILFERIKERFLQKNQFMFKTIQNIKCSFCFGISKHEECAVGITVNFDNQSKFFKFVDFNDMIKQLAKKEFVDDKDAICTNCKNKQKNNKFIYLADYICDFNSKKQFKLLNLNIIRILQKEQNFLKLNHKISIPKKFEFPVEMCANNNQLYFDLVSIVHHEGNSINSGHFYLDNYDKETKSYYRFNDLSHPKKRTNQRIQITISLLFCFLDFYRGYPDLKIASAIYEEYLDDPVISWRNLFYEIANQLAEYDGEELIDDKNLNENQKLDEKKTNLKSLKKEEILTSELNQNEISLKFQNCPLIIINYYVIDLKVLYSRNPFLLNGFDDFSFLLPNYTEKITSENPIELSKKLITIPKKFQKTNVFVMVKRGMNIRTLTYFSSSLKVQLVENYAQVKVNDKDDHPLSKVYVKIFSKNNSEQVEFYKDGYSDFRGRFDYASLNNDSLNQTKKFSIFIMSDLHVALVKEANPPSKLGR